MQNNWMQMLQQMAGQPQQGQGPDKYKGGAPGAEGPTWKFEMKGAIPQGMGQQAGPPPLGPGAPMGGPPMGGQMQSPQLGPDQLMDRKQKAAKMLAMLQAQRPGGTGAGSNPMDRNAAFRQLHQGAVNPQQSPNQGRQAALANMMQSMNAGRMGV